MLRWAASKTSTDRENPARNMVDASRLGVHQGQLGPICDFCGARLTFGQALPIDEKWACNDCYREVTGAESSVDGKQVEGLPID